MQKKQTVLLSNWLITGKKLYFTDKKTQHGLLGRSWLVYLEHGDEWTENIVRLRLTSIKQLQNVHSNELNMAKTSMKNVIKTVYHYKTE